MAANDLRRRFRSKSFVIQAIVGPLLLSVLISLAFGGGLEFDAEVGVAVEDRSEVAQELRAALLGSEAGGVTFVAFDSEAAATAAVEAGDVGAAFVVPAGFGDSLVTATPRSIDLVIDRTASGVDVAVTRAVADAFAARVNVARLATSTLVAAGRDAPDLAGLGALDLPIVVDRRTAGDEVSPAASVGPGIGLLFLFLSVATVARALFEERRLSVLDRIRSAPVSTGDILFGKGIALVVLGCVTMGVLWLSTQLLLGARWGDPLAVSALIVASAAAVAGIAASIAGLVRSERTADLYATMVAFVFGILGGSLIPLSELPPSLVRVSLFTPNGWALRGFATLSAGDGHLSDVAGPLAVLAMWALAAGLLGLWLLPRRLGTR